MKRQLIIILFNMFIAYFGFLLAMSPDPMFSSLCIAVIVAAILAEIWYIMKIKPKKEKDITDESNYETEYKYPSDFVSTDYWPEDKPFPFKRTARRRAQRLIALPRRRASRK